MASLLSNALNMASRASQAMPSVNNGFLQRFANFRNMFGGIMNSQNPEQIVRNILMQRGIPANQIDGVINQYASQATEIQKQLSGMI